jgi:PAS domain S-box-containing protein
MIVLLSFLIIIDVIIVAQQRNQLHKEVMSHMKGNLELIGTFAEDPLLKQEYAKVENFLNKWISDHDEILQFRAIMPNDLELVSYRRPNPSDQTYSLREVVTYDGRKLITLELVRDALPEEIILGKMRFQLIAGSILLTTVLGAVIWIIMRRMALAPMEQEIITRRQTEEMLSSARETLETLVRERTKELRETNKKLLNEIEERKKVDSKLRTEKVFSETIINSLPGMFYLFDGNGTFRLWNKNMERITEYSAEEIASMKPLDFFEDHVQPLIEERIKEAFLTGEASVEAPLISKSGKNRDYYFTGHLLSINDEHLIVGTGTDITELKQAEKTLIEREERLQTIIDTEPECVKVLAPDGTIVEMNASGLAMIEADSIDQAAGKSSYDIVVPEHRDKFIELTKRVCSGQKGSLEFEIVGLKGTRRWLNTHAVPLRDSDNKILGLLGVTRDITKQKHAEEALRQSEEKFSKSFRSSPTLMSITTVKEGRFIEVNDAFLEASGYSRKELVGNTSEKLGLWVNPAERDEAIDILQKEGIVRNREIRIQPRSAEVLSVLWSAEKIEIEDNPCILAVALDITERKKLENQLLHAQKMEAVGQLAGGIAHDFNNIITAIISYGYLAKSKLKDEDPFNESIDKILSLTNRAAQITQGLLAFSRKQYVESVPVKLNEILRNVEKILVNFIGEDIELQVNLTEEDPVIKADRARIEQALLNLATNARDAMPEGGLLKITTELFEMNDIFVKTHGFGKPGTYALLTVTDTGEGMDEETRQKIFEPFFTTKEVGKGTGLGLATTYGIIKQHNGYINVYSEPGSGATFKIHLPEIKTAAEEEMPLEKKSMQGRNETILLAEDESSVRDSIKNILEEFGYQVITALNGKDAVSKYMYNKKIINLIILDVVMPEMNGKEAYEEIRKASPDVKAIFTSGYTSDIMQRKGFLDNGLTFISKPIQPENLLSKIREVLDSSA